MPKSSSKKGSSKKGAGKTSKKVTTAQSLDEVLTSQPLNLYRAGMPSQDSIIGVTPAASTLAEAPGVSKYRIIQTNEVDAYEKIATAFGIAPEAAAAAAVPTGDNYKGKDRKVAKLSIAKAKVESFHDLKDLIASLTPEKKMKDHDPPLKKESDFDRVVEEQRNVRVEAFLYAASRENDNDFHLILGRDPNKKEMYMTMEISGLPPKTSPSFNKLKAARDAYKKFYQEVLNAPLPGLGYGFLDPPVPVTIEGSLFFDVTHSTGSRPGPQSLKSRMPVIWEVHPVTKITFKP